MSYINEQKKAVRDLEKVLRDYMNINLEILDKTITTYYDVFPPDIRISVIDASLWYVQELANLFPKIGSELTDFGNMQYLSYITINENKKIEKIYHSPPTTYKEAALKCADLLMHFYSAECDAPLW